MRYTLQESDTPGWWVATDTEYLIVARFRVGDFNSSQQITLIDESLINPATLPRLLRELGDWLAATHPDKI